MVEGPLGANFMAEIMVQFLFFLTYIIDKHLSLLCIQEGNPRTMCERFRNSHIRKRNILEN